jgi:hypothetical protein
MDQRGSVAMNHRRAGGRRADRSTPGRGLGRLDRAARRGRPDVVFRLTGANALAGA